MTLTDRRDITCYERHPQRTLDIGPMLVYYWATVGDIKPAPGQCLLFFSGDPILREDDISDAITSLTITTPFLNWWFNVLPISGVWACFIQLRSGILRPALAQCWANVFDAGPRLLRCVASRPVIYFCVIFIVSFPRALIDCRAIPDAPNL